MSKKQNYSYKTRRSDTLTNRMMIVFILLLVSVFTLLSVRNWLGTTAALDSYEAYMKIAPFFPIIPIILTVLAAIYFINCKKNKKDEALKTLSSSFILSVALVLLVVSLLVSTYIYSGYIPAVIFIILVSLLYFIAISFPGSYLVMTVFNALAAFTIYALHLVSPIDKAFAHYSLRILAVLVAFVFIALVYKAKANNGILFGIRLLKHNADLFPLVTAAAIFAAFVILGMFEIGSYLVYDVIIALETIIFALFYSIKMLK